MFGLYSKREGKIFFPSLFKFTFILLLLTRESYSQNENLLQKKAQFGFNIASTLIPKPQVTREFGMAKLLTRKTFGFEAGITLKYLLTKNVNLNTGVIFGKLPYSWGFYFKEGEFASMDRYAGYDLHEKGSIYDINYWYFPLNVECLLLTTAKLKFNILAGANVRHYLDGQTSIGYHYSDSTSELEAFSLVLDVNYPYQLRINYQLGTSGYIKIKNLNEFKISLLHNFSFAKIVKGYYGFFPNTDEYTFGSYSMTGSYWALSVGYVLTGERKLRRENENDY